MRLAEDSEKDISRKMIAINRIGSLEGQEFIAPDYDIAECNDEIAEMFGVMR